MNAIMRKPADEFASLPALDDNMKRMAQVVLGGPPPELVARMKEFLAWPPPELIEQMNLATEPHPLAAAFAFAVAFRPPCDLPALPDVLVEPPRLHCVSNQGRARAR